jgi:hypothetical protein
MTSLEGNRKLHDSDDFARGEHSFTSVPDASVASHEPPAAQEDAVGGGADALLLRLCADCGAPIGRPYVARLPLGLRSELPLGPNGGVLLWRRVPGTDEWIQLEYFPPDDAHDDFWLVEPLLPLKVAAIVLGLRVKTLYDRAGRMASSEKHGRLWFFKRDLLLTVDAASEAVGPSRAEILAEREERRARGEIRRAGSHRSDCDRRHAGSCGGIRQWRSPERERARIRRAILDDLGK